MDSRLVNGVDDETRRDRRWVTEAESVSAPRLGTGAVTWTNHFIHEATAIRPKQDTGLV